MAAETVQWTPIKEYQEILFSFYDGIAKISINRPHKHNAFTPLTVQEMIDAMNICREDPAIKVIILTGEGGNINSITAMNNMATDAVGTIGTFTKNGKTSSVFHGTLRGKPDPKPNKTGWGAVIRVPPGDNVIQDFAAMSARV